MSEIYKTPGKYEQDRKTDSQLISFVALTHTDNKEIQKLCQTLLKKEPSKKTELP